MEMKSKLASILGVIIILILVMQNTFVFAATKNDLKNEKSDLDDKINAAKELIDDVEDKKSETLKSVQSLTYQISDAEDEVDALQAKVNDLQSKIKSKEADIQQKEEEYNEQEKLLDQRLIAIYENGNTSYLDVLLTSASLTEFLSNYYAATELVECDKQLIKETKDQKAQIESEKSELETNKRDLDTSLAQQKQKQTQLKSMKNEKENYVAKLNEEEKKAQADLEQFERDKKEIDAQLKKIAEEEARRLAEANKNNNKNNNGNGGVISTPSASGYICPLAGKTKANITTGYGKYSWGGNHTGVDWAIARGTPILAVKDGTVIDSKALKNPNGTYKSYGEYITINHHDGTITLYAHGLEGSRLVQPGDSVKRGQQIMSVGTTGNSSGYHLHFEVRLNGVRVNPTPYLP